MSYESKKNAHLHPRGIFCKTQWAWQGVKLTRLISIFTSKKVWKFLIEMQLTKSDPKRTRGGKCPASCQLGLKLLKIFHYLIILQIVPLQFHALLLFCKLHQIFSLRMHIKSSEQYCSKILLFQVFEHKVKVRKNQKDVCYPLFLQNVWTNCLHFFLRKVI